jgi:hypothetical protein
MVTDKPEFVTCKECNREIKKARMASHKAKHIEMRKKKFAICPICKHEMRRRRIELNLHFASNHPEHTLSDGEVIRILTSNRPRSSFSSSSGQSIRAISGGAIGLGKKRS